VYFGGYDPALAVRGDRVGVAFVQGHDGVLDEPTEVLYKLWNTDTRSWDWAPSYIEVAGVRIAQDGQQPDLAFDSAGRVWLTWIDTSEASFEPYYARVGSGSPLVGPILESPTRAQAPRIAVDAEDSVHVVWSEQGDFGSAVITHMLRAPGGVRWLESPPVFGSNRAAYAPDVSVSAGGRCVVWHESTGSGQTLNTEVWLACGARWDRRWNLSNSGGVLSLVPRVALDDHMGALVAWQERTTPRSQILFQQDPYSTGALVTEGSNGAVDMPALAYQAQSASNGFVHAAWSERTADGADVYYARWRVTPPPTPTPTRTTAPTTPAPVTPTPTGTPDARGSTLFVPYAVKPVGP
jgi:hypothetical protein